MPVLTLIGLIFTGIKLALEVIAYLQAHPEVTHEAKVALRTAGAALTVAQEAIEPHAVPAPPEAP